MNRFRPWAQLLGLALFLSDVMPSAHGDEPTNALTNPGMEAGTGTPLGWSALIGQGLLKRDTEIFRGGTASLCLERHANGKSSVQQLIAVKPGAKLKLTGWLKTDGAAKASLAMQFFDSSLFWTEKGPIKTLEGTQDWQSGELELVAPDKATRLAISLMVEGIGKAWFDDVSLSGEVAKEPDVLADAMPTVPVEPTESRLVPTAPVAGYYKEYPKAWMLFHEANVKRAKQGNIDLLFLGDSITQGWNRAQGLFDQTFGPYKPAVFGIGGDKTGNLLWRLDHGEVDGLSPKLVVLMIGVNNLWSGKNNPAEIAGGISAVVNRLTTKLPKSKVLVLGVLPTGEKAENPGRNLVRNINEEAAKLDNKGQVRFLDVGPSMLQANGLISKAVMGDFLHPTETGYELITKQLVPVINEMMK